MYMYMYMYICKYIHAPLLLHQYLVDILKHQLLLKNTIQKAKVPHKYV